MPDKDRLSRRTLLAGGLAGLAGCTGTGTGGSGPSSPAGTAGAPARTRPPNPFDALYPPGFRLSPLAADPEPAPSPLPYPPSGLADAVLDPRYRTRLYRAARASQGEGGRMRHEYSRRQAFNADCTRYLTQDGRGAWYLNDATTLTQLRRLPELVGDCEPIWHSRDPDRLYLTGRNGATSWWSYDVTSGTRELWYDFAQDPPWPQATGYWTRGEGTTSADGRYLTLLATSYDAGSQRLTGHGVVVLDLEERRLVGRLDAADFPTPGALPDHVSTSPSGEYAVVSWLAADGGTRAWRRDFSTSVQLAAASEHSDLAVGADGQDYLVYADYGSGQIRAITVATGDSFDLHPLYPAAGEGYAVHLSGQGFDRPGWVVVSTYADFADHGSTRPAPAPRPEYRKVWLLSLSRTPVALSVCGTQVDSARAGEEYFAEPQATVSRDLSRILFASNAGGPVESYLVGLPSWVV